MKALNIQVIDELYDAIQRACEDEGMTKRQWVSRALMRALPENMREDVQAANSRERGITIRVRSIRSKLNLGMEVSESDRLLLRAYDKRKRGEALDEQEAYAMIVGAKLTDATIPREEADDEDEALH